MSLTSNREMVVLRLKSLPWALLVGFPIFLAPSVMSASSSTPGSPLSEDEYRDFFTSWKPDWKMRVLCQIRRDNGCHDPRIVQTDQLENHGLIPDGPVCADLPQTPSFESFCLFAVYRCSNQKLYTKRILCPKQSLTKDSNVPTERPHSSTLEASATDMHQQITAPSQEILIKATSPYEIDIQPNVDEILKFAFSISGQKPMTKEHTSTTHSNLQSTHVSKVQVTTHAETSFSNVKKLETTEEHIQLSVKQHLHPASSQEKPLKVKNKPTPTDGKHHQNFQKVIPETKSKGSERSVVLEKWLFCEGKKDGKAAPKAQMKDSKEDA